MLPEEAKAVADHQRRRFNELVDVFDRPQPPEVMARLREIVASAELRPGAVVLDVGTGAGVLIPLVQSYQPSAVFVCAIFMNGMYGNIADKPAACGNAARLLRPGGRLVVSHPEGRAFVDQLRATSDLFIESLPTKEEFGTVLKPLGLEVIAYRDEPKLYLMVARKS